MRTTLFKAFLLVLCLPQLASAAVRKNPVLSRYFMMPQSLETMNQIATRYEIEARRGAGYLVLVPTTETGNFLALAPGAQLLELDISARLRAQVANGRGWHDFESVQSDLDAYAKQYPQLVEVGQYGKSDEGNVLRYLHISSKAKSERGKPQLVITGSTHGNELITVEVVLGLADKLIKGYGTDTRLTKMVDTHDLYFIPVACPDGYTHQERYCDGVDPNRDYPYPENPDKTNVNTSIKAIMDFFAAHEVKGSIDYHSAAAMVMYPWAYTYDPIPEPDRTQLDQLATKMAETNGYAHGPIASTIYIAPGSSADYYYWKFKSHSLGIEISQDGSPDLIPSMLQENTESTWRFIESF